MKMGAMIQICKAVYNSLFQGSTKIIVIVNDDETFTVTGSLKEFIDDK